MTDRNALMSGYQMPEGSEPYYGPAYTPDDMKNALAREAVRPLNLEDLALWYPGPISGLGAVMGALGTAYLSKSALRYGGGRALMRQMPLNSAPTVGGAAVGYAHDVRDNYEHLNTSNDAEGQRGGFYGNRLIRR